MRYICVHNLLLYDFLSLFVRSRYCGFRLYATSWTGLLRYFERLLWTNSKRQILCGFVILDQCTDPRSILFENIEMENADLHAREEDCLKMLRCAS